MKILILLAMTSIIVIFLMSGCGELKAYFDPEETIDSAINKVFIVLIALDSNPSTGYSWEAEFDANMLELIEETYELGIYARQGIVGAGGTELFRFKGLSTGKTEITFKYKRPLEPIIIDTEVFTVEIK